MRGNSKYIQDKAFEEAVFKMFGIRFDNYTSLAEKLKARHNITINSLKKQGCYKVRPIVTMVMQAIELGYEGLVKPDTPLVFNNKRYSEVGGLLADYCMTRIEFYTCACTSGSVVIALENMVNLRESRRAAFEASKILQRKKVTLGAEFTYKGVTYQTFVDAITKLGLNRNLVEILYRLKPSVRKAEILDMIQERGLYASDSVFPKKVGVYTIRTYDDFLQFSCMTSKMFLTQEKSTITDKIKECIERYEQDSVLFEKFLLDKLFPYTLKGGTIIPDLLSFCSHLRVSKATITAHLYTGGTIQTFYDTQVPDIRYKNKNDMYGYRFLGKWYSLLSLSEELDIYRGKLLKIRKEGTLKTYLEQLEKEYVLIKNVRYCTYQSLTKRFGIPKPITKKIMEKAAQYVDVEKRSRYVHQEIVIALRIKKAYSLGDTNWAVEAVATKNNMTLKELRDKAKLNTIVQTH